MRRLVLALALMSTVVLATQAQPSPVRADTPPVDCSVTSLKQAIAVANTNAGHDTIELAQGCVYTLELVDNAGVLGDNGLPVLTGVTTIEGNGATIERSSAAGTPAFRILESEANLFLNNLTIRNGIAQSNGDAQGGGVRSGAGLAIEDTTIVANAAIGTGDVRGGGLFAASGLAVSTSTISQNSASGATALGGGANSDNSLLIQDSTVSGNQATASAGLAAGGGTAATGAVISRSLYSQNVATGEDASGGAVYTTSSGGIVVSESTLTLNRADAVDEAMGGGAWTLGTSVIDGTTFSQNSATGAGHTAGGGAYSQAALIIGDSTFSANKIASDESEADGAGAFAQANLAMTDSTFSGNQATAAGPARGGGAFAGGQIVAGSATITGNSVSSSQAAATGGGLISGTAGVTLGSAIVVDNQGGDCAAATAVAAATQNLDSDGSCGDATTTADAGLLPLALNFPGKTATHALKPNSPAVDAGLGCDSTDQRGVARPQGPECDLGAYELSYADFDTNCDGQQDALDVLAILNALTGLDTANVPTAPCPQNFDGVPGLSLSDAMALRQRLAGLD